MNALGLVVLVSIVIGVAITGILDMKQKSYGFIWPHIWCRRHGLKFREGYYTFVDASCWWGEDSEGRRYVPGKGDKPELLSTEGGAK